MIKKDVSNWYIPPIKCLSYKSMVANMMDFNKDTHFEEKRNTQRINNDHLFDDVLYDESSQEDMLPSPSSRNLPILPPQAFDNYFKHDATIISPRFFLSTNHLQHSNLTAD